MSHSLLESHRRIHRLPIHIAQRVLALRTQAKRHGEHTTAGKLVTLIETVLSHLGRLWTAEYLRAGAPDPELNRDLFDRFGRRVVLGHWVAIGRAIRDIFVAQKVSTVVHGLQDLDFGTREDDDHPVTRLVQYRNSFSHGSLTAIVEDIRHHRQLLETLLEQVPGLTEQPIHFRTGNGTCLTATLDWPRPLDHTGSRAMPLQPFIMSRDGMSVLKLYPLLYVVHNAEGYALQSGTPRDENHPLTSLFDRETLRMWYERYRREQRGHLTFDEELARRDIGAVPEAVLADVAKALNVDDVSLIIVEAYPGCGKAGVLTRLSDLAPSGLYDSVSVFLVTPGDLGQSGVTFGRFLLRRAEEVLGLPGDHFNNEEAALLDTLENANQTLQEEGKRILVGVDDLHFGYQTYRREPYTIAEVYGSLTGGAIHVVAAIHPGRAPERLVYDRKIEVPVPDPERIQRAALARTTDELISAGDGLHRQVLKLLVGQDEPLSLFAVCDGLEAKGSDVFEPAVERTLWDLRPLLTMDRGPEKVWKPFSPALKELPHIQKEP